MELYNSGIGVCAGSYMLKWDLLNQHIHRPDVNIHPGDTVNVFINFECVLKNLSTQKDLAQKIVYHKQKLVIELESAILNLMASYRMYFKKEKCNVKMYFYYTDINCSDQLMSVYNKYYRSYYHNRYMQNPQFSEMGELLSNTIIPEIELILFYVPECYFIKSKTFDGSIIPYIISTFDNESKNIIVTGDIFDTLYMFNPIFTTIYIKRRFQHFSVISEIDQSVQSIVKNESPFDLTIFNSELYYRLLLSIKGSKIRNIKSAKGFGYGRFMNILKDGIDKGVVLRDFSSIDSVIDLFPEQYRSDIKTAFQCTSIDTQYSLLSDTDIEGVKSQIVDKVDIESVEALNNKRFLEFPINIQGLIN
jgi:hypothetical protein